MGVGTRDIFGEADGAQPATEGSYGEAPSGYRLPATTHLGEVHLQVRELAHSLAFYEGTLGLRQLSRAGGVATLGAAGGSRALVVLHERAEATPAARRSRLGLYHFAILLPSRAALGAFVRHLGEIGAYAGAGDHLVSEAFYLTDPDGLGIEVYADRPRDAWKRVGRQLMMATDPVDVRALLRDAEGTPWHGMPAGTVMGHVHLHVGDIERAAAYYSEALGFDELGVIAPGRRAALAFAPSARVPESACEYLLSGDARLTRVAA